MPPPRLPKHHPNISYTTSGHYSTSPGTCPGRYGSLDMQNTPKSTGGGSDLFLTVARWFDSDAGTEQLIQSPKPGVDWLRIIPFIAAHLMCLAVFWVGWSWAAVTAAILFYLVRMFAITGFYHRYFSHRSFKTNRFWQFVFALLGSTAVQRGPLWWASHHRHHHRFADREDDVHSPTQRGFLWSHMGWFTEQRNFPTKTEYVPDWLKYPELRWLNRFSIVVPLLYAVGIYLLGVILQRYAPELNTNGFQMLVWGFFISTVLLFHGTATINSLSHVFGSRRYDTPDTSRNNPLLALITLGEGWHNNHHRYAVSAQQGFHWWEVDITYYLLVIMSWLGIVHDLRPVPVRIRTGEAERPK